MFKNDSLEIVFTPVFGGSEIAAGVGAGVNISC